MACLTKPFSVRGYAAPLKVAVTEKANMNDRCLVVVDGENLTMRYQSMLACGNTPRRDVFHLSDICVWHGNILWVPHAGHGDLSADIYRVAYYASCTGDDAELKRVSAQIAEQSYTCKGAAGGGVVMGRLTPHVFKKLRKSQKTRQVDIHLCLDALRGSYINSYDTLALFSGDSDYVVLAREVMKRGKKVVVGALSNGLSDDLRLACDLFISLDDRLFGKKGN